MPVGAIIITLDISLMIHAAYRGRFMPWGWVIFLLPGIGSLAYLALVCAPEWLDSPRGLRVRRSIRSAVDRERSWRLASDNLIRADTIANRAALAEAGLATGRDVEALEIFTALIGSPFGDEPAWRLGKARAELALGRPEPALATLEELEREQSGYRPAERLLLYARALEDASRLHEAARTYAALERHNAGVEPRVRLAELLLRLGEKPQATSIASEVIERLRLAPRYVRRQEKEWLRRARLVKRSTA
jgi:hypothetical protein